MSFGALKNSTRLPCRMLRIQVLREWQARAQSSNGVHPVGLLTELRQIQCILQTENCEKALGVERPPPPAPPLGNTPDNALIRLILVH